MEFRDQIRQFITSNFYVANPATLSDEDSLMEQGIVDSTGMLDLIMFLEREFGVQVDDSEMIPENLDTIGRINAYLVKKRR